MCCPYRAELLRFIQTATDEQILAELPYLPKENLQILHDEMAPEECTCEREYLECDCGDERNLSANPLEEVCRVCGALPDWIPCAHAKKRYLPFPILVKLQELLHPDRKAPHSESLVLRQDLRSVVLAQRQRSGVSLWHSADLINDDLTGSLDRYKRLVTVLRNGSVVAGELAVDGREEAKATIPFPQMMREAV